MIAILYVFGNKTKKKLILVTYVHVGQRNVYLKSVD